MNSQTLNRFLNRKSGLLCNHTSWDIGTGSYFFEMIPGLCRIFFPEHGLFAEYQDQVPVTKQNLYKEFGIDIETISLYGKDEFSLLADTKKLQDLDVLFVDLQDVGSRYFTYSVTLGKMIKSIVTHAPNVTMVLIDRENPAGVQVEGSKLPDEYRSFIGWPGLPHRHGLTLGELALFFYKKLSADFPLYILPVKDLGVRSDFVDIHPGKIQLLSHESHKLDGSENSILSHSHFIPPSPNIPTPVTPYVYSGQCLLEGTNLSEGRGTTRPFEQFGAPYLKSLRLLMKDNFLMKFPGAVLRPIRFLPTFHKWKDEICEGFHIHLTGNPYHSLLHSLYIIRTIRETYPNSFKWREGVYEYGSDKKAIELLAGDSTLLDFLMGEISFHGLKKYLENTEKNWLKEMRNYKIYARKNYSVLNEF